MSASQMNVHEYYSNNTNAASFNEATQSISGKFVNEIALVHFRQFGDRDERMCIIGNVTTVDKNALVTNKEAELKRAASQLEKDYKSIFDAYLNSGVPRGKTLVLPPFSTGVGAVPYETSAKVSMDAAVKCIDEYLKGGGGKEEAEKGKAAGKFKVIFRCYPDEVGLKNKEAYEKALGLLDPKYKAFISVEAGDAALFDGEHIPLFPWNNGPIAKRMYQVVDGALSTNKQAIEKAQQEKKAAEAAQAKAEAEKAIKEQQELKEIDQNLKSIEVVLTEAQKILQKMEPLKGKIGSRNFETEKKSLIEEFNKVKTQFSATYDKISRSELGKSVSAAGQFTSKMENLNKSKEAFTKLDDGITNSLTALEKAQEEQSKKAKDELEGKLRQEEIKQMKAAEETRTKELLKSGWDEISKLIDSEKSRWGSKYKSLLPLLKKNAEAGSAITVDQNILIEIQKNISKINALFKQLKAVWKQVPDYKVSTGYFSSIGFEAACKKINSDLEELNKNYKELQGYMAIKPTPSQVPGKSPQNLDEGNENL